MFTDVDGLVQRQFGRTAIKEWELDHPDYALSFSYLLCAIKSKFIIKKQKSLVLFEFMNFLRVFWEKIIKS